jgi:hypothetical protein
LPCNQHLLISTPGNKPRGWASLILDHLEDAVFAPESCCLWCADSTCDGTNCASTFDPNDFQEATALFMQQLQPLVANSKLEIAL